MIQIITIKLRLRDRHTADLNRQARSVNIVWNFCNETSRKSWARDQRWLSGFDLGKLTSGAGGELGLHSHTIQKVCQQFARSRDAAKRAGMRWRGRKSLGWVPFNTGHISFDGAALKFRGVDYEPMHLNPRLSAGARIGAGSFSQDSRGRWYVSLPVEVECAAATDRPSVGIDLGLKTLATLSDGGAVEMPAFYRRSERALATAQRARKTKRARTIQMKAASRRKDFLHKASSALAKKYGTIVIGDVSPSKLARTNMAKSIYDAGWSDFKRMLAYKAIGHGGRVLDVPEAYSSQTCSECGSVSGPRGLKGLAIRGWVCADCGSEHDRDVNGARNILRVGLDTLAEGARA